MKVTWREEIMNIKMKEYIDKHQEDMIRDLAELVAIPSESDDHEEVRKALRAVIDLASGYGFKAYSVLDDQVGIVEMGDGDETLGILTHVDVVPAGNPEGWLSDPYKLEIRDDKIYGRGTLDDKGMVIASLYAMMAIKDAGLPVNKKIQLIIGTQEEVEWTDMDQYVKEYPLPDYGFTPDGSYPICNIEKGYVDQTMEFDVSEDEAAGQDKPYIKELDIGTAVNVVPGIARAVLSDGEEITVHGVQCHSSQPEMGVNAMLLMGDELTKKDLCANSVLELLNAICSDFRDSQGGSLGLRSEDEYYQGEFVHRNIFTPTVLKAKDGKAEFTVNVRSAYGESQEKIIDTLDEWAKAHGGRTAICDHQHAVFVPKDRPFLQAFADAYEDVSGLKNDFVLEYGGTYAKAMPNIVSWGPLFPGDKDTCHEDNECLTMDGLMVSTGIFAEAIAKIVETDESFK